MLKPIVALYIRLSVEDTKTESLSIQNQRMTLKQYAQTTFSAGDVEIREFVDNGYSGTNFERPAVQELLDLVRGYAVDCIIVKDFSRFGRNSIETGYFIEQVFPLYRTRFISISDGFDSANYKEDTGGMEVAFKYLINEYYSRDLSRKSKAAKYTKMKRGEYQSKHCCYGYKKSDNNRLELDDEAAQVVREIYHMIAQGRTTSQVIRTFYEKGILTPGEYKKEKGCKIYDVSRCHRIWQRSTILRILSDERYIGTYVIGKRTVKEVGGTKLRLKDESEWFKIADHHPAIIDKAEFEQVQALLKHFNGDKKFFYQYPLRSKIFCRCCGHAMIRTGKKPRFICNYTKIDPTFTCHGLRVAEAELESAIFTMISKQAAVLLNLDNISNVGQLELQLVEKAKYENRMQECQDRKQHLYEQYMRREIILEKYKALKSECDIELTNLKRIYVTLSSQTEQLEMDSEAKSKMLKIARDIEKEHTLTRGMVDLLIDKVFVDRDNHLEIRWKIQDFCKNNF